ncbi:hypothetical protein BS47DRAFT_1394701 [Hydnum rufescens UP504]|uniref:Uncharacterized protein n=1 Tax=Hydnum rufescens UP504 TaxID=1448309 RepID=A0A9P6ATU4_9AGAM|nr:hypothetical protein BS47DRAFT_1394701 [Hydnum rufescens UP504]
MATRGQLDIQIEAEAEAEYHGFSLGDEDLGKEHHDRLSFAHFSLGMRDLVGDFIWTGKRYEEGLHPPSGGKRRWYHARMPLPMGNHLPAQQALVFVPSSYHEQGKMVPSSLGIEVEMLDVSGGLLSTDNERTPEASPDLWYSLVVEPFMTEIALLSMVDVVQSRGAEGWKQTRLGKSGFSLGFIFKSRTSRDDVYHFLKEDAQFSKVVPMDPAVRLNSWLPYRMFKEPGYIQHLWKYSHPLSVHGALLTLSPPSRCLPPSEPGYEFARERERCHQTLIMVDLLETDKPPAIIRSHGPDPPKCAYSRACPEEALSLQCLEILLSLLADFNASFLRPIYPARSGPYVKLLHFIASRVEFAAQSNSMQCDVIPQAQQEKLNVLQLTEAIGYKLDTKQFFINWDPSSPTPSFIPSLSTLEADQAQSEERVKNLKTSKAKCKGKMVK